LRLQRATIDNNAGGGIKLTRCQFSIVNNFLLANGGFRSFHGGIGINEVTSTGLHDIQFTTIVGNGAGDKVASGITCNSVLVPLRFANNLIYDNAVRDMATQVGGDTDCTWAYSDIGPQPVTGTADGGNNINEAPAFVDIGMRNLHLQPTWPHRNKADPTVNDLLDIDGDRRPLGGRADMGADEVVE